MSSSLQTTTPKRKRRWWRWTLLTLSVAAGLSIYLYRHQPIARIPLPDGTEFRVEYVTYGTQHRVPGANRLVAWVSEFAQRWPSLQVPLYTAEYTEKTETPTLVLWTTHFDSRKGKFIEPAGGIDLTAKIDGHSYQMDFGLASIAPPMPYQRAILSSYDRRQSTVQLTVVAHEQTYQIEVPNPAAKIPFPVWQPEPLPQTRRVGEFDLVLTSCEIEWVLERLAVIAPRYDIYLQGKKTGGLEVFSMTTDATGNNPFPGGTLPRSETAWKIIAEVRRTADVPAVDDGITLGPIPMPAAGQTAIFKIPDREHGAGLHLVALLGRGRYLWKNGVFVESSPTPPADPQPLAKTTKDTLDTIFEIESQQPQLVVFFKDVVGGKENFSELKWMLPPREEQIQIRWNDRRYRAKKEHLRNAEARGYVRDSYKDPFLFSLLEFGGEDRDLDLPLPEPGTPVTIQIIHRKDRAPGEVVEFLVAPPKLPERPPPASLPPGSLTPPTFQETKALPASGKTP